MCKHQSLINADDLQQLLSVHSAFHHSIELYVRVRPLSKHLKTQLLLEDRLMQALACGGEQGVMACSGSALQAAQNLPKVSQSSNAPLAQTATGCTILQVQMLKLSSDPPNLLTGHTSTFFLPWRPGSWDAPAPAPDYLPNALRGSPHKTPQTRLLTWYAPCNDSSNFKVTIGKDSRITSGVARGQSRPLPP